MSETNEIKGAPKFKFRELMVYSSTEWLADNKKKYRQVFDRYETSYIYAELSFHNKEFDRAVWEVNIDLKCYDSLNANKEVCALSFKRKVSKYDNVVFIREGWGNKKEGVFWKKGTYYWEAWIDGEKVATKYFYVEDVGVKKNPQENLYFDLESLKLYEGKYDDVNEPDRTYLVEFSGEETRYIYNEIILKNKNRKEEWHCEIFAKFYNEARELKGQVTRLQTVKQDEEQIKISAGWGSNVKGSWRDGRYTVELVFMNKLIAVVPFMVGEVFEEGIPMVQLPNSKVPVVLTPGEDENQTFEELMMRLDGLIGLSHIKKQVREHAQYIKFLQLRKDKGFEEKDDINVHSVFKGNPGTGKTTVARLMGLIYRKMGLLSKGHVHEVDRVDLVGEYIGQTAPKVKEAIEKARGGVLFIDEAYALARANDDSKDFGREVIEILVKEMSNGPGDMAVIVAGYPKEMEHFVASNPGLKSRFKLFYEFKDYLPQELSLIAEYACVEKEVVLTESAKAVIDELIVAEYRERDKTFGNARFVFDLIEKAKVNLGLRVMKGKPAEMDARALSEINVSDVVAIKNEERMERPNIPVDYKLLDLALSELNSLIGIENVKKQIRELVEIVKYHKESRRDVLNNFYLHTVFVGNPGTGKTTVARILTKIYKALGILERGHMIETDRQGLVAGFVGQTATKTAEKIEEAMGGVLFIDEAYALSNYNGLQGDYGNEAIQTILKRMEDHRGEFFIFAAGYPDNMEVFLKANPGLSSRFDKILKFDDYTPTELSMIAMKMISDEKYHITPKAVKLLSEKLQFAHRFRDKFFGNARDVRNIVLEIIKNQNLRLSSLKLEDRPKNGGAQIVYDDVYVLNLEEDMKVFNKPSIGFNK
ncbi:AAA family ATPase [Portibacter marinus]|uniref:AAA family ATPase n=1 Tax=Portibacter marinus TaxID=2898660 RepID=UPI001F19AA67|nr:AAA family ATPase [Portibacter marinus]